ncbi:MAG: 16S rRNA (uracil(1498)-N(3))-methyltransferase [Deltaproteobacteria bacterium]|nr:MAG: 16S rRNA (uracil(1498)-N(3))-methyltransferase [Deltaproteobacteria bacterium]
MSDPLRFFVSSESLQSDQVVIAGEPYHHLRNVLRVKPGAIILLFDGFGQCCEVQLEQLQPEQATTRVIRRWREKDVSLSITLLQALPKGDKFDLVLQKGTELGVRCFQPIETDHAIPNLNAARLSKRAQRWQRIVSEAARQSRRNFLPEVKPLQKLARVIDEASSDLKLVLWEASSVPLADALPKTPPSGVRLLIGPEGGFSASEIISIMAAGFQAVHLGPRILRTETAGLAATPILQYLYGDWQHPPADSNSNHHEENL